jgi:hypothetical protein
MADYTPDQQSAFDYMDGLLNQYDLSALADTLKSLIVSGVTDSNELTLALQGTDAWKTRFAGNEMLKKAGVPVLSVAQYLSTEQSYAQVMKNYGLPKGFYDDHADFANFIGNNVSANELQQRVSMYADVAKREDPSVTAQLASMGMSQGDLLAYVMDPTRAEPIIQQKYSTALLGGAARRNGLVADNADLAHLSDLGISEQQANQGFGQIGQDLPSLHTLGDIYGLNYDLHSAEADVFENNAQAGNVRKRLASQERGAFGGSAGTAQGSLKQNTSGTY